MKITVYELAEGWVSVTVHEQRAAVSPVRDRPDLAVRALLDMDNEGQEDGDEQLVTGPGPCHGEHCRHVSHGRDLRWPGQVAHDAYARALGHGGARFERLSVQEREAWITAAAAVMAAVQP